MRTRTQLHRIAEENKWELRSSPLVDSFTRGGFQIQIRHDKDGAVVMAVLSEGIVHHGYAEGADKREQVARWLNTSLGARA